MINYHKIPLKHHSPHLFPSFTRLGLGKPAHAVFGENGGLARERGIRPEKTGVFGVRRRGTPDHPPGTGGVLHVCAALRGGVFAPLHTRAGGRFAPPCARARAANSREKQPWNSCGYFNN